MVKNKFDFWKTWYNKFLDKLRHYRSVVSSARLTYQNMPFVSLFRCSL